MASWSGSKRVVVGQQVLLVQGSHGFASGTQATVIGFYARGRLGLRALQQQTVVVRCNGDSFEVELDEIEPVKP